MSRANRVLQMCSTHDRTEEGLKSRDEKQGSKYLLEGVEDRFTIGHLVSSIIDELFLLQKHHQTQSRCIALRCKALYCVIPPT